jgi:hypothetical protein
MGVEAPDWQGVETQEYLLYFKFSQRSQAGQGESPLGERGSPGGWIGAQKREFILKPARIHGKHGRDGRQERKIP